MVMDRSQGRVELPRDRGAPRSQLWCTLLLHASMVFVGMRMKVLDVTHTSGAWGVILLGCCVQQ